MLNYYNSLNQLASDLEVTMFYTCNSNDNIFILCSCINTSELKLIEAKYYDGVYTLLNMHNNMSTEDALSLFKNIIK